MKSQKNKRIARTIFSAITLFTLVACGSAPGQIASTTVLPTITEASATALPAVTNNSPTAAASTTAFDGQHALNDVIYQVEKIGNRAVGTPGHDQIVQWISSQLKEAGWEVQVQTATSLGHPIQNIIAYRSSFESSSPWIIVGAHYDSRMVADQDPNPANRTLPMPGANDGASGVAVLLELARSLPKTLDERVWLCFWDAEDNGDIPGWDWILGSKAFVASLGSTKPDMMVNIDMIGDAQLDIQQEQNSVQIASNMVSDLWNIAKNLGYSQYFQPVPGFNMLDDHTPFISAGIPAVDLIDFTYPDSTNKYWHTTMDTPDKVSAQSMVIVGNVLTQWLEEKRP